MEGPSVASQLADDHAEIMEEVRGLKAHVVSLDERVGFLEEFKPLLESIAENIAFFAEVVRRIGSTLRFFAYLAGFTIVLAGAYEACARLGVI